ncbi:MAG: two-component system, OmpR family, phosphate regulon response regulator PhoB [Solirubrobacterales bacterium]|nr:two-component system, OmpR family, phosphate regulon response regulator PhoB [Solirubrobacterales bacterium]MDX6652316.1 two-component system, OmpR family, phosphate regulon response regulator PhoB [Solirubrobacterales bacterium]MDX6663507.1 two-component system, OmpR family, phosphate regulon response regulator PhoB [Solirubrobacterales bacterium]
MTRLLVADDSETIRLLLERRLAIEGYEVESVCCGQDVLDRLDGDEAKPHPDVILLDAMMPGKSGLDVLRELRDHGDTTPVLMVSAHRQLDELRELGADGFMTKPIDWDELIAKIEELTGAPA